MSIIPLLANSSFDPEAVRALTAASDHDVAIGGAQLAASALAAGLVDVLHQFVTPVVVGGGQPWLAADVRLDLELRDLLRHGCNPGQDVTGQQTQRELVRVMKNDRVVDSQVT